MEKTKLLNTYVNNVTLKEAVEFLLQKIRQQTPAYVVEVNVDVVVKMEQDTVLRKITNDADLTLVDGQPLIWLAKLYGRPLKMKVSGSDLVPTLLECAAKEGRSVFVLGGKEDAAHKAAENIKARYPGLVVVGALSPSMGFEKKPEEVAYIRETLQKVKPDILLACFGCPKQEKWVSEHYRDCASGVTLCAGATVDFLAGNGQARPEGVQREWTGMVLPFCEGTEAAVPPLFCGRYADILSGMEVQEGAAMKLGILCTMINGFGRRGYYNSQEVGLGRALAAMGHELTIYKGIDPSEEEEKVVVVPGLVVWYLPMRHLGAHGWMPVSALDAETKALFCFGDQQLFLPHIYRWCKRHGAAFVPYIGTAHSLNDGPKGRLMNILFETGTLRIYKNNPVLAKTSAAKAELEALGVERITVAPVGLDTSVLKQDFRSVDRDALRREHGYAPEDVVLCNVSRLSPEKRPLELIDLFLKIRGKKPFKLIIVGNGTLENALKEKIHFNGLEQEVTLYENVPYPEMWKIYCMSDYYVNMNKGEIFGMAIMEAVYYCTSVAAYRAIGPSVTLKDMKGHALCDDDDVIAQWLLAPYPSRQELEESAAKVARDFSWERCARAFLDIVQNASNSDVK